MKSNFWKNVMKVQYFALSINIAILWIACYKNGCFLIIYFDNISPFSEMYLFINIIFQLYIRNCHKIMGLLMGKMNKDQFQEQM